MASITPLQGTLGLRRAVHLLRRTSFRYTKAKVDQLAALTADRAVAILLQPSPVQLDQPVYDNPSTTATVETVKWINPQMTPQPAEDFVLRRYVLGWWVNEALHDEGIGHKMTFFHHQNMIVAANAANNVNFFDYLALLRWGALGNFKALATKMITDNSMLRYLNNNENVKGNPNENFAREYLELFTIGKGPQVGEGDYTNYTEEDIAQAARVFTGIRTRAQRDQKDPQTGISRGIFQINQHDTGNKTFSKRFQDKVITGGKDVAGMSTELLAFVDMIFAQPETARNFCRRLYRFLVSRNITPEIERDVIEPLATQFRQDNYEIKPIVTKLLQSRHFYDADDSAQKDEIIGGMIKSPLELALQSISFFNIPIPDPLKSPLVHYAQFYSQSVMDRMFDQAGLPIFMPDTVAGYTAYYQEPDFSHQWFNSTTIIARYKLPTMLLTGKRTIGGNPNGNIGIKLDIAPWVKNSSFFSKPTDPRLLVKELLQYMLPDEVDSERFNYFYLTVFLDNLPPADWTYEWEDYLKTGKDTEVQLMLGRLVTAIMYSQEYQTF